MGLSPCKQVVIVIQLSNSEGEAPGARLPSGENAAHAPAHIAFYQHDRRACWLRSLTAWGGGWTGHNSAQAKRHKPQPQHDSAEEREEGVHIRALLITTWGG